MASNIPPATSSSPLLPQEQALLETYFTSLSEFAYEKAKDHVVSKALWEINFTSLGEFAYKKAEDHVVSKALWEIYFTSLGEFAYEKAKDHVVSKALLETVYTSLSEFAYEKAKDHVVSWKNMPVLMLNVGGEGGEALIFFFQVGLCRLAFPKCEACKLTFAPERGVLWTEIFKFGSLWARVLSKIEAIKPNISIFFFKRCLVN